MWSFSNYFNSFLYNLTLSNFYHYFLLVVVLYLLIRVDKTIENSTEALTNTIIELQELIRSISTKKD
jgi:hypothetical protein